MSENRLFWRCEKVVSGIESGVGGKSGFAGLYTRNEVRLCGLCGNGDGGGCEDALEVDDLEGFEFGVHVQARGDV